MRMPATYEYDPGKLNEFGKDLMRFELGDTLVSGGANTCALTDEEIQSAIDLYPKRWKRAKLALLESLMRRFAYEVDTRTGPLSLSYAERAKMWRQDYEKLKAEVGEGHTTIPAYGVSTNGKPPAFRVGMMENMEKVGERNGKSHVPTSRRVV